MGDWLAEEGYFQLSSGWVSRAWNILFKPTPVILKHFESTAIPSQPYIALHFRAGNETAHSWVDPPRHGLGQIDGFLDCAEQVRARLRGQTGARLIADATPLI